MVDLSRLRSPREIQKSIAQAAKIRRVQANLTQKDLAERAGTSRSAVLRFEQEGEVSLANLIAFAAVLGATGEFAALFPEREQATLDELEARRTRAKAPRARRTRR